MTEPDNLVLQLLREMRADMATKADVVRIEKRLEDKIADVDAKVMSLAADVASDFLSLEKRLSEQISGLRRSVMEYHSTAIGHGVVFTELEERVRKIEQHLNLSGHGYPTG
jgi:CRISPR/Cas system type I-B associated protein Csh2 (Cas7 group RAMP superfamily)